jgi:hypothetical protein
MHMSKDTTKEKTKTFLFIKDVMDGMFFYTRGTVINEKIDAEMLKLQPSEILLIENQKIQFILLQIIKKNCIQIIEK